MTGDWPARRRPPRRRAGLSFLAAPAGLLGAVLRSLHGPAAAGLLPAGIFFRVLVCAWKPPRQPLHSQRYTLRAEKSFQRSPPSASPVPLPSHRRHVHPIVPIGSSDPDRRLSPWKVRIPRKFGSRSERLRPDRRSVPWKVRIPI